MVLNGTVEPKRLPRFFKTATWITLQLRTAARVVQIGHDAQEARVANNGVASSDGIQITQANSSTNYPGAKFHWQGELWYASDQDNVTFSIVEDEAVAPQTT